MKTGYRGTFVISWSQTEVDGLTGAPVGAIDIGTTWRWTGEAVRVDSPRNILVLENAIDMSDLHRRAAKNARRIVGAPLSPEIHDKDEFSDQRLFKSGFDLTDGLNRYRVALVELSQSPRPMVLFLDQVPPKDQDLWVVHCDIETPKPTAPDKTGRGVVCFVPGTRIATPNGPKLVQELVEGDRVSTKDNGEQEIQWIGHRRVTGARLFVMPHMRPIRLRANILGQGEPDQDLVVSPDHRILVKGDVARSLFNTPEVLVSARDLVNDTSITVDHSAREVTYIHMMLDQHQILWANGVESESFHPAGAHLDQIETRQCQQLFGRFPDVADDPFNYGDYARRNLSPSEAAILAHAGQTGH